MGARPNKKACEEKINAFYEKAKLLIDFSGGEVKMGMVSMIINNLGFSFGHNVTLKDLEKIVELSEQEWKDYAMRKFFPSFSKDEKKLEPANPEPSTPIIQVVDYSEPLDNIFSRICGLGSVMVKQNDKIDELSKKLDRMIELQERIIDIWKS